METEIDLTPFLCEAFSTNPATYSDIDKIYNKDKLKFISLAKQNKYYNHQMAQEGSVKQEYYFKKVLGILIASGEDDYINNALYEILECNWRYSYVYAENHDKITISKFLYDFVRKNKGMNNIGDDELNSNVLMLIIFSQNLNKEIDATDDIYNSLIQSYSQRLLRYTKDWRVNINDIPEAEKELLEKLELKIKKEGPISFIPTSYRLKEDVQEGMLINTDKLSKEEKFFDAFERIYDFEGISLVSIVGKDYLSSKEIQETMFCYTSLFPKEEIDYKEFLKFIYPAIEIRYLCKEYNKAKQFFFQNFNEQLYEELHKKEELFNNIKLEKEKINKESIILKDENNKLKNKIKELEKENKKLSQKLNEKEDYKKEVSSLREFIFNLDNQEEYIEKDIDTNKLKNVKAVVIGGHEKWQQRMKELLPNFTFIHPDALNFDINILNNADIVFIYTNYLNHAMYYKVINEIRKNDIRLEYLSANTNENIVLKRMCNLLGLY